MKWVTRERPKIDRIACPWLILRFIDANAEFLYVPAIMYDALYAWCAQLQDETHRSGLPPAISWLNSRRLKA